MYNQQSFTPSLQTAGQSQYRSGIESQSRYQPTGPVQSYYQRQGMGGQSGSTGSYHMAHYQGNQPGHDQYLRSDSNQPSSYGQGQMAQSSYQNQFGQGQTYSSVYGGAIQSASQFGSGATPQSYHMANYRGDQPGHDQYLRSDSSQPSSGYGQGQIGMSESYHLSNYRGDQPGHDQYLRSDSSQPSGGQFQNQFGQPQFQNSIGQTESYHMANYRGNQPGHDQYLRADSTQPTGMGQPSQSFR